MFETNEHFLTTHLQVMIEHIGNIKTRQILTESLDRSIEALEIFNQIEQKEMKKCHLRLVADDVPILE